MLFSVLSCYQCDWWSVQVDQSQVTRCTRCGSFVRAAVYETVEKTLPSGESVVVVQRFETGPDAPSQSNGRHPIGTLVLA